MERFLQFAERVGIPSAILLFVLWKIEARLDALTSAVAALPSQIALALADAGAR